MDLFDVVSRPRGEKKKKPIPAGLKEAPRLSGALPVVGHTVEFVRGTIELLFRAQRELGEVAAFDVAHRRMVAVFGPKAQEAVFRAPDTVLSPSEAYKITTPIFGKDVVYDAPPEKMAEQLTIAVNRDLGIEEDHRPVRIFQSAHRKDWFRSVGRGC